MQLCTLSGGKQPVLVRTAMYFTGAETLEISLQVSSADSTSLEGMTATVGGVTATVTASGAAAAVTAEVALNLRQQSIDICCQKTGCRTLYLRVPVYRQAVIS